MSNNDGQALVCHNKLVSPTEFVIAVLSVIGLSLDTVQRNTIKVVGRQVDFTALIFFLPGTDLSAILSSHQQHLGPTVNCLIVCFWD